MSDLQDQEIARLKQELERIGTIAEEHAFSVRQVAAQRARLFKVFAILGQIAKFDDGGDLSLVTKATQLHTSQFLQDVFSLLFSRGKRDGFFVEFGACDGLLISNTVFMERELGWNGILSEPSRSWQDALKKNRKCILDFRCVYPESGQTVSFAEYSDDAYGTQSSVLEGEMPSTVETISLYDLFKAHNAPKTIDFISIDVEGGEYDILKPFPFDEYRFEFMCVEHMTEEQETRIKTLLEGAGYRQILRDVSGHDGYYVPKDSDAVRVMDQLAADEAASAPETGAFWEGWYKGTQFTSDWSTRAFADWSRHLSDRRDTQVDILEIGAWEGRATIFFLNYFKRAHVTCLDIFTLGNEPLFDANVMSTYGDRVRKLKGRSGVLLDGLSAQENREFDLIYVDGSHDRDDVMQDSLLAWRLLKVGGLMIWDDYQIVEVYPPGVFTRDQDPKPAIDTFLSWRSGEYELVEAGYQMVVRKTQPHYRQG
jgi:FkbM family methyltransferase